jgi:RimJ/RimL family protein N-acetyltransferase
MIETARLHLTPFSRTDFDLFVAEMLTDPLVVEHYHSYKNKTDMDLIRRQAEEDFWEYFEESRTNFGLEIYAIRIKSNHEKFIGWAGLLQTSLTDLYGGPELQYMISGDTFGQGFATEAAAAVLKQASPDLNIIDTVDIPNVGSIRVLEKLGFECEGQIHAYGSSEMYLYKISQHV